MLVWIKEHYGDIDIIITENGVSDSGGINDDSRISYYQVLNGRIMSYFVTRVFIGNI